MSHPVTKDRQYMRNNSCPEPNTGCWFWELYVDPKGYGRMVNAEGRSVTTHRESYRLFLGPIPAGLWVLHKCDQPGCVNPAHLFLGTHQDNMDDMHAKGRFIAGKTVLTKAQVIEIYTGDEVAQSLADRLGVQRAAIYNIRAGIIWPKLTKRLTLGRSWPKDGRPKLTPAQVTEIYQSSDSDTVLAARFNTVHGNIWNIRSGKTWGRVTRGLKRGT